MIILNNKIKKRQYALKELIKQHEIEDQHSLVQMIKHQFGIETNQAAISRDLRALGVSKRKINNKMIYELPTVDPSKEILRLAVQNVQHNENLIVIDTLPGMAAFVGDYLDMHKNIGILGVLAGENVLFVTPTTTQNMQKVFNDVCQLVYVKKNIYKKELI